MAALPPYCVKIDTASEECYLLLSLSLAEREANPTQGQTMACPKSECASSLQ